tara:strand:+ start:133 stop:315 length:183 start_codon:yes stop_codon:yes gene_type:complete
MKKVIAALLITVSFSSMAGMAFLKYERKSGMNKICVYNDLGSDVTLTVKNYQLCPLTINT